ncbi:MAG: hydrolase [Methylococcaceae bacterium]|nr:hydrolase [Methylococcaceae bacterium]
MKTTVFKSAWWLKNPHFQTLYPTLFRKIPTPLLRRERLITPDNDFIDIDWYGEGDKPLIILLHGLTGSSESVYIKGLQHLLFTQNFRSVTLNFRGCSGEPNQTARCYHSGETEDIHFLYQTLREREPNTLFAAIGFSLGGNVLLKWLGEQSENVALFAAVAVSVPFVLSECSTKLNYGFSKFYRMNLLRELKTYIADKQTHLEKIGFQNEADKLNALGDLSKIKSFWEYDERVVAKLHGFRNAHDYYARSSSRQFLKKITVPTLLIQAIDDPFMTKKTIPEASELSDFVQLEMTEQGGHVGFVAGKNPFEPVYWLEQRISNFLEACLSKM